MEDAKLSTTAQQQPEYGGDKWKLVDVQVMALNAIGRTQSRYLQGLVAAIATLWAWQILKPTATKFTFFGIDLPTTFIWVVAPALLTWLNLTLIGTINTMGPINARIDRATKGMKERIWFSDLDTNKNVVDYLGYLRIRPLVEIEPHNSPQYKDRSITHFLYPCVILGSVLTTLAADYPGSSRWFTVSVFGAAAIQVMFGFRICFRAVCRFLGVKREQTAF